MYVFPHSYHFHYPEKVKSVMKSKHVSLKCEYKHDDRDNQINKPNKIWKINKFLKRENKLLIKYTLFPLGITPNGSRS